VCGFLNWLSLLVYLVVASKEKAKAGVPSSKTEKVVVKDQCVLPLISVLLSWVRLYAERERERL
jgi:hypothetical protein